ncbi:MAG: F0F1 ATP synthase subunit A [Dehalococcoidia bacterium]
MKRTYLLVGFLLAAGLIGTGLFVAKGPQPEIIVPAEVITKVGFLNITNTMITAWMVMAFLIVVSFIGTRSMSLVPSGVQNFLESVIGFLVGQIEDIAGEELGRRFFSLVATIFLFLIVANWFGLLPFFGAIGKTEDVGYEIFHELANEHPHELVLGEDGHYAESHDFAGVKMSGSSSFLRIKNGAKTLDFEVHEGETPGEALDRYIVFLAKYFAGFDVKSEAYESTPEPEVVQQAAALLNGQGTPLLLMAESDTHDDSEDEHGAAHGLESPALQAEITGVSFEDSEKLALVIPFFRSVFSDVNNTLAMGIVAFFAIEFWGFQALGLGYLTKFFNLKGIMSFVGILEFVSEIIRIISFAFRLFGNIFAGEVLILMLTFLMPFLLVDIIYMLELFVGFIQASVFALLTLVFAMGAVESHGDDHDEEHGHGHAPSQPEGAVQAH